MNSSKVMVVCPNCGQATRIKKELQGDKKYVSARSAIKQSTEFALGKGG